MSEDGLVENEYQWEDWAPVPRSGRRMRVLVRGLTTGPEVGTEDTDINERIDHQSGGRDGECGGRKLTPLSYLSLV